MTAISKTDHSRGIFLLILTTAIWGTSFPLSKDVLDDLSPAAVLATRFAIPAIAFAPYLRHLNPQLLRDGAVLGLIYFTECVLALVGLETISANRSAFIVSLNVILVPLLGTLIGRYLPRQILVAVGIAIAGITLLSWEGGGIGLGELLTFGCAIGAAVYILALERIAPRHSALSLMAIQLAVMAVLGMGWALPQLNGQLDAIVSHFNILLYLGLIVTATPIWTQAQAQRWVSASETALLYTLEPVFASVFSFFWLGEALGARGLIGATLIVLATVWSQFPLQHFLQELLSAIALRMTKKFFR